MCHPSHPFWMFIETLASAQSCSFQKQILPALVYRSSVLTHYHSRKDYRYAVRQRMPPYRGTVSRVVRSLTGLSPPYKPGRFSLGMTFSIPSIALNRSIFFFVASFSIGLTRAKIWLKNDGAFKIRIWAGQTQHRHWGCVGRRGAKVGGGEGGGL